MKALQYAMLAVSLCLFPLTGRAQQFGDFSYSSDGTNITITKYTGAGGDVSIPSMIAGLPVASIGGWAFQSPGLTSVTIPDSVTSIGDGAFYHCSGVTAFTVEAMNVSYSSLDGVLFDKSQTTLIQFPGARTGDYTIPDSVTSIGYGAFYHCSGLTSVTIPDSVTGIGYAAFSECSGVTAFTVEAMNVSYSSLDGVLFDKSQTRLIQFPGARTGDYTIPDSVTSIGYGAFSRCSGLTSVTIRNSVTNIGELAFYGCWGLTSVTIGNRVTSIGYMMFHSCSGLTNVTIPDSVTSIADAAFYHCSGLTSVTIGNRVTSIGYVAFNHCSGLTNLTIPDSVTSIGEWAFASCSGLTNVTMPNSVTNIGEGAFSSCTGLTSVCIPDSVTSIGNLAFHYCSGLTDFTVDALNVSYSSLDGVLFNKSQTTLIQFPGARTGIYTIPNSVTNIGDRAFAGSSSGLTNVTIPDSVTSIRDWAFSYCIGLTRVTIPDSVTNIGTAAFCSCSGLTAFAVETANPAYSSLDGVLFNQSQTTLIQFPEARTGDYTIPDSVTTIGDWAFYQCYGLTSVTIPDSVTSIGDVAFLGCSRLTSVTIGTSVTSIGDGAFYYCDRLLALFFRGNAPWIETDVLYLPTVCYYLPGTSGWGAAFGGRPAYLWNPAPQTSDPSFGVGSNGFGFNITGTADIPIVVEASTNLTTATWVPLLTCTLTNGLIYFSDPAWRNFTTRAYRIRSPLTLVAACWRKPPSDLRAKAEAGDVKAQNELGEVFQLGKWSDIRNPVAAVKWFRQAAEQKLAAAQSNLGVCYERDVGVTKDEVEAYKWYLLAAAQGDRKGKLNAATLEMMLSSEEIADGKRRAQAWLTQPRKHPPGNESSSGGVAPDYRSSQLINEQTKENGYYDETTMSFTVSVACHRRNSLLLAGCAHFEQQTGELEPHGLVVVVKPADFVGEVGLVKRLDGLAVKGVASASVCAGVWARR